MQAVLTDVTASAGIGPPGRRPLRQFGHDGSPTGPWAADRRVRAGGQRPRGIRDQADRPARHRPDHDDSAAASASSISPRCESSTRHGPSRRFFRRRLKNRAGRTRTPPLPRFPLSWSHYVRLLSVGEARGTHVLRGRGPARRLDRAPARPPDRHPVLRADPALPRQGRHAQEGQKAGPGDALTPEEEIKDPFVLEFLDLKDEYSESDLEEALIRHLETFLLELGDDFTFVGRQRRLRIDDEWYRIDLVFFHRRLRCLILIDLKLGKLTPGDAGQMHLYLNYAREHWTHPDENPPVGLILCAEHRAGVARYALEGLPNKVLAAEYRTALPSEETLAAELERTRKMLEARSPLPSAKSKKR